MKRNLCLLLLCVFAISALAQSRFMEIMAQTYAKPERVYQYYVHHQPDSIYSMGVKTFSAYFTSEQFSSQIRALDERLGQPVEASFWETRRAQGYEVYSRNIIFPRHTATLTVAFDSAGELVGFTLGNEKSRVAHGERDLTLTVSDSVCLPARLTLPTSSVGKGRVPVAILVHGSGPSNMDESIGPNAPFRDLAEGLSRRGVAVLRYDKRTYVYPQLFIGKERQYTYDDETVDDALTAIRLVKDSLSHDSGLAIDSSRVYIIGHSLGGMLAPRIAERSGRVAGLVLLAAPTGKLRPTMERQLIYLGKSEDEARRATDQVLSQLPDAYLDFDAHYSPTGTAHHLSIPLLILQGGRDYQVTMNDYKAWHDAVGRREDVVMKSYPSLNHLFIDGEGRSLPEEYNKPGHVAKEVIDDIADFILSEK